MFLTLFQYLQDSGAENGTNTDFPPEVHLHGRDDKNGQDKHVNLPHRVDDADAYVDVVSVSALGECNWIRNDAESAFENQIHKMVE